MVRRVRQDRLLSAVFPAVPSSEFYGKISVVGERTDGSVPTAFGEDISSFGPEDSSMSAGGPARHCRLRERD